jgi:membrane fusion protein (multidrug efflux system)
VTLTLDDGSIYAAKGKMQFTDVTVDPTTGTVRLRAIFPNPDGLLLPGLYVRATINEGVDPHGILVPQLTVSRNPKGEPTVLVLDDQNMTRLRLIKTGRAVGGDWQVLDGLKAGDKLIVQGLQNLRPDMKVTPMPAQTAPTPAAQPGMK